MRSIFVFVWLTVILFLFLDHASSQVYNIYFNVLHAIPTSQLSWCSQANGGMLIDENDACQDLQGGDIRANPARTTFITFGW